MAAGSYACDAAEGTPDGVGVTTLASGSARVLRACTRGASGRPPVRLASQASTREAPASTV